MKSYLNHLVQERKREIEHAKWLHQYSRDNTKGAASRRHAIVLWAKTMNRVKKVNKEIITEWQFVLSLWEQKSMHLYVLMDSSKESALISIVSIHETMQDAQNRKDAEVIHNGRNKSDLVIWQTCTVPAGSTY